MSVFDKLREWFGGGASDSAEQEGGVAMISCEDALRLVHEFMDGELVGASAEEMQQHFDMCQRCYPHLRLEAAFRDALKRATSGQAAPPELRDKVVALLEQARSEG